MNKKTVRVDLGINSAFMTRRYEEPKSWIGHIRDLGFDAMSFDSDALDPFFSGDPAYLLEKAAQIREIAAENGVRITDYLTGYCSYRFMGLSHREEAQRRRMVEWIRGAVDIAAAMGASSVGGRFDALSVEVLSDPYERRERIAETVRLFQECAAYAQASGLSCIANEIMYVPSLYPHTLTESEEFFRLVNNGGAPVRPIVDTGHCCGQNYGVSGDNLRYESWLEQWGAACEIIHIQQTRRSHSDHLPFGPDFPGDVKIEEILNALQYSISHADELPWAGRLEVPDRITLVLEALPGTSQTEESMFAGLKTCAQYLRSYIPVGGLEM